MKYNYIAIEGNIGAGKTTLAHKLAGKYSANLILEEFAENSFLEKFYENPAQYAFPLEVSFLVERFNQLQQRLGMNDLFRQFTVADYFFDKSIIFAQNNLKDDQYRLYYQLFDTFLKQIARPDILLYLSNSVTNLQRNIHKRGRHYELNIEDKYLGDIQDNYLRYFRSLESFPIVYLDIAESDFVQEESKFTAIEAVLSKDWPKGISFLKI